jgi:hypothetical protein
VLQLPGFLLISFEVACLLLLMTFQPDPNNKAIAQNQDEIGELVRTELMKLFGRRGSPSSSISIIDGVADSESDNTTRFSVDAAADIESIDVLLDDEIVNSTIHMWFPIEAEAELAIVGMLIDTDLNEDTGLNGFEYTIYTELINGSWQNIGTKWSPAGDARNAPETLGRISTGEPYSSFTEKISFSTNLESLDYPSEFNLVFVVSVLTNNGTYTDYSNVIHIPPPKLTMSTVPESLELRPGDRVNLDLLVNSSSGVETVGIFNFTSQVKDLRAGILPDPVIIRPYGAAAVPFFVQAQDFASPARYPLSIVANISYPSLVYNIRLPNSSFIVTGENETIRGPELTATVLEPLTISEQISKLLNDYIVIVSLIPLIITIVITGVISKRIDIKGMDSLKKLGVSEIIQIDATVIAGVLIFLTIGSEFNRITLTLLTGSIVYPFAISALRVITKGSSESGIRLMLSGFIYLMVSIVLISIV